MRTRVLKFGGSSFRTIACYTEIADKVIARLDSDADRLVVVVSAMYGDTDRLLAAGLKVSERPQPEALDSLITAGEVIGAALLRMAIEARGVSTSMRDGHRIGIVTDSNFTRAAIQRIDAGPLRSDLAAHRVVVVTGAQAIDAQGRLTMLGRNSSDLTAVALAGALGLPDCEILSDVPGVYSADPYVFRNAQLLREISHAQLIAASRSGAKVIHFGAADYARRHHIQILCRSTADPTEIGTVVGSRRADVGMVVLNEKADLLRFVSKRRRDAGVRCLRDAGLDSLTLGREQGDLLACNPSPVSSLDILASAGFETRRYPDLALMTVLHPEGRITRRAVPRAVAREAAQRLHDEMQQGRHPRAVCRAQVATRTPPPPAGTLLSAIANVGEAT